MSNVKFSKKQKAYIIDCINKSLRMAKDLTSSCNGSSREFRLCLLGALKYDLSEIVGVNCDELFSVEGK